MITVRPGLPEDIPAQRELWKLAFGDSDSYLDNFYDNYYRPGRVVVLEEDGAVRSMTAWFDTDFVVPGQGEYRAAYLYAVATHPDSRGRGLAGRLLTEADEYFRSLGVSAVTTVPAEQALHDFFGANGFRECFRLTQGELNPGQFPPPRGVRPLRFATPTEYKAVRDQLLARQPTPYIRYPEDALTYQAGCCILDGGGLLVGEAGRGPFCLCVEGDGRGAMVCKEQLGGCTPEVWSHLFSLIPARGWTVRFAPLGRLRSACMWKFAMLKWLDPALEKSWDWNTVGYLGLAFD